MPNEYRFIIDVHDFEDHRRPQLLPVNCRAYVEFQPYHRCLIPGRDLYESFKILPGPILKSNLAYAETEQQRYAARNVNRTCFRIQDTPAQFERYAIDRKILLKLGACRALVQRCWEHEKEECVLLENIFSSSLWDLDIAQIKMAHQLLDNTGVAKTNCPNYFKQFWPVLHKEVFDGEA